MEEIRLTQFSHGAGCGCKIAPRDLETILSALPEEKKFPALLVGNQTRDDAAVYALNDVQCLIATTDFFTPIVDDAFTFGKIAAANALSDVYAMGGNPIMALAVLGWPVGKLPLELVGEVMRGARTVCEEAHVPIAGGHSIDIPEPVFGLSVNGLVEKKNLKKNDGARAGDFIYITKPLGVGILSTAEKRGVLQAEHTGLAAAQMVKLNRMGALFGAMDYVHAMTDITGFGLLGHLLEMCNGARLGAEIRYTDTPVMDAARHYAAQFVFADNTTRNWNAVQEEVDGITGESMLTLCDPQTNGGLMVAVDPASKNDFEKLLKENHLEIFAHPVGRFTVKKEKSIYVM